MVDAVARLRESAPAETASTFAAIAALATRARTAVELGDRELLGALMDDNQRLLETLRVSSAALRQICETARTAGALGAKLTGAGGGGCAVALVASPEAGARVLAAWKREGFEGFSAVVGGEPVRRVPLDRPAETPQVPAP